MKTRLAQRAMFILLAVMLLVGPAGRTFADEEALWERLREGGLVVLVRHALAPGTGDPSNFRVDDCSTQRNLSETGREQARLMGARFAAQGVAFDVVLSSQWCRCLDTASEAFGADRVVAFPVLNSFFSDRSTRGVQTDALAAFVDDRDGAGGNVILVTHQVNISAYAGVFTRSGEAVIVDPAADDAVLGSIEF